MPASEVVVHEPERAPRFFEVRAERDRPLERRRRLFPALEPREREPEAILCGGIVGVGGDGIGEPVVRLREAIGLVGGLALSDEELGALGGDGRRSEDERHEDQRAGQARGFGHVPDVSALTPRAGARTRIRPPRCRPSKVGVARVRRHEG